MDDDDDDDDEDDDAMVASITRAASCRELRNRGKNVRTKGV